MMGMLVRRPLVAVVIAYVFLLVTLARSGLFPFDAGIAREALPGEMESTGLVAGDVESTLLEGGETSLRRFPFNTDWYGRRLFAKVSLYGPVWREEPRYGEMWRIRAKVAGVSSNRYGRQWVYLNARGDDALKISGGHGSRIAEWCYRGRKAAAELLSLGIHGRPDVLSVLHSIMLGYRQGFDPGIKMLFYNTGTLHIFAISGLHVGIIGTIVIMTLKCCRVSKEYWVLYLAPILVVYTIATGARASAVRACIMMIVYFLAPLFSRKADMYTTIAFAALMILALKPDQLFDIGFIYSFTVVSGIVLMAPRIESRMGKYVRADPMRVQEESRFVRCLRFLGGKIVAVIAVSVSAWLASAPLTVYFFHRFAPVAVLSNIIVVPLALLIVTTGCLSLVLGSCLGWFAIAFNWLNLLFVSFLLFMLRLFENIPYGSMDIGG